MSILFLLIPLGLLLVGIAVWAFFWAVASGQFDDLSSPAWSVLMDDDEKPDSGAEASSQGTEPGSRHGPEHGTQDDRMRDGQGVPPDRNPNDKDRSDRA